jgi:divalent metal cation (Fe/Co/Zn/Cd) transporter
VHNFRVIKFGRTLHIDCHVTLPWYYSLEQAHSEITAIERLVNEHGDQRVELFIHMDPCIPASCAIHDMVDCPHRQAAFVRRIPWTLENALSNKKHGEA